MFLEQEMASIIKFMLDSTDNPYPYYYSIPEDFVVPAAYFPNPEIMTDGETLLTYGLDFALYVKFFAKTSNEAYELAFKAVTEIRKARNLIPLIDQEGKEIDGEGIRIYDPSLRIIDEGVAQAEITWRSRRPYNDPYEGSVKLQDYTISWEKHSENSVSPDSGTDGTETSDTDQALDNQGSQEGVDPEE